MHCECGPQDLQGKQPTVQGKQAGCRVKRSEMGLSVRVGCPSLLQHVPLHLGKTATLPSLVLIGFFWMMIVLVNMFGLIHIVRWP